jgi:hypothetical protein
MCVLFGETKNSSSSRPIKHDLIDMHGCLLKGHTVFVHLKQHTADVFAKGSLNRQGWDWSIK